MSKTKKGRRCPRCKGIGRIVKIGKGVSVPVWTGIPAIPLVSEAIPVVSEGRCDFCQGTGRIG